VRVPRSHLVGPENGGWELAKYLLAHERTTISGQGERFKMAGANVTLPEVARGALGVGAGPLPDPAMRAEIARVAMDAQAYRLTTRRVAEGAKKGQGPGPEASILKYYYSELNKRSTDLRVRLNGLQGCGFGDTENFDVATLQGAQAWLRARGNSIEGGTSEIQLNVIAKRVLGLPD